MTIPVRITVVKRAYHEELIGPPQTEHTIDELTPCSEFHDGRSSSSMALFLPSLKVSAIGHGATSRKPSSLLRTKAHTVGPIHLEFALPVAQTA